MTWHQKPPLGRRLNHAHPLAKGLEAVYLINEQSGYLVNDLTRQHNGIYSDSNIKRCTQGLNFVKDSASQVDLGNFHPAGWKGISLFAGVTYVDPSDPDECSIFGFYEFSKGCFLVRVLTATGKLDTFTMVKDEAGYTNQVYDDIILTSDFQTIAVTQDTICQNAYRNGIKSSQNVITGNIIHPDVPDLYTFKLGGTGHQEAADAWSGDIEYLYLWKDRKLTDNEVAQLHANPYAMFQPDPIWLFGQAGLDIPIAMYHYINH